MDEKLNNELRMEKNSEHPWLSVVMPIYNAENSLGKCIESVLRQDFRDFEFLLVDDGSTDNSARICMQYANTDRRIRVLSKTNGGSFQARIFGAEQAKGEYITFCDADDYYFSKNAFSVIHDAITQYNCDALQFGYYKKYRHLFRKANTVHRDLFISGTDYYEKEYPRLICSFWNPSHLTSAVWNKVYHRRLLKNLPSSASVERLFCGEDIIINLFMLENASSVLFLSEDLYVYQIGSGGMTKFRIETMNDLDYIKRIQLCFMEKREDKDEIERTLHSETAGWFFLWVRQATSRMDEVELKQHIERILELPGFASARHYYQDHMREEGEAIDLLRKGDPMLYLEHAKNAENREKGNIKYKLISFFKKVYSSI